VSLTRRRGQELESALLEAAYAELEAGGYAAFTLDRVAERARTSRPVLARRWATREELILAAIRHHAQPMPAPNTGSLRDDLIAALTYADQHRTQVLLALLGHLGGYIHRSGRTLADLRQELIQDRVTVDQVIIQQAIDRGEIDAARVTPRIAGLAFDLFRHEALMTEAPVPVDVIREIVDTIVLPLLTGRFTPGPK
jgi:AcrR family transcriptional regulator